MKKLLLCLALICFGAQAESDNVLKCVAKFPHLAANDIKVSGKLYNLADVMCRNADLEIKSSSWVNTSTRVRIDATVQIEGEELKLTFFKLAQFTHVELSEINGVAVRSQYMENFLVYGNKEATK